MMATLPDFAPALPSTEKGLLLMQTVGSLATRKPDQFSATITRFIRKREGHMGFLYGMFTDKKLTRDHLIGNLNVLMPELGAARLLLWQVDQLATAHGEPIPVLEGLITLTSQALERIAKGAIAITTEANEPIRFELSDERILAFPAS